MGELQDFARAVKAASPSESRAMLDQALVRASAGMDMAEVGRRYLYGLGVRVGLDDYTLDKTPLNFFYVGSLLSR